MKRRDFLTKSVFIFTGILWVPKLGILKKSFAKTNPYVLGVSPNAATFGNTTDLGGGQDSQNTIRGNVFTAPANGIAQSITMWADGAGWGAGELAKCALYDDDDNDALIKVTEELTGPYSEGWVTFNFDDPKPRITSGTDYALCHWADSSGSWIGYDTTTVRRFYKVITYNSYPNPFDGTVGDAAYKYSIYCTYIPD